jgi:hypothetical protein
VIIGKTVLYARMLFKGVKIQVGIAMVRVRTLHVLQLTKVTPRYQLSVEGDVADKSQWTVVAHRKKSKKNNVIMIGAFWNVRGLNQPGRNLSLEHLIKNNRLDFVGVQETKREEFPLNFLRNLTNLSPFSWHFLPTKGTAGGILVGVRDEKFLISSVSLYNSVVCCLITDKNNNFDWTLVVVYGPPCEDRKVEFIDELHLIISKSHGPVVGGHFNLSRFVADKSNGRIV